VIGAVTTGGAVYTPALETLPRLVLPPATPSTFHTTPWSEVPVTFKLNVSASPAARLATVGDSFTPTAARPGIAPRMSIDTKRAEPLTPLVTRLLLLDIAALYWKKRSLWHARQKRQDSVGY
jgi:hypothetical protein